MNANDGNGADDDEEEEAADMEDFEESGMLEMVDPVSSSCPFSHLYQILPKRISLKILFFQFCRQLPQHDHHAKESNQNQRMNRSMLAIK